MNNSLVKGLALLETIALSDAPMSLTELSEALGLVKSNVHRLLQGLLELHYVSRDDGGAYRPSMRFLGLATAVVMNLDMHRIALPIMERVLEQTRETVHLSVLDGDEVVYIAKLDSPEPVRAYSQVGGRAPAHCVATGKAMLAFQDEAVIARLSRRLKSYSPKTIMRPDAFIAELEAVRADGFAVNRGEWRESVRGIAAPIFDPAGRVIAAIGVSGPAERIKATKYAAYGSLVIVAATAIAAALQGDRSTKAMKTMLAGMKRDEKPVRAPRSTKP
jgi:IclR family KDG regulon transcriptional repressor